MHVLETILFTKTAGGKQKAAWGSICISQAWATMSEPCDFLFHNRTSPWKEILRHKGLIVFFGDNNVRPRHNLVFQGKSPKVEPTLGHH